MRIDGWHVDGFGILKDYDQTGLEPGVTVLLGENEAGKTTLLAFIRTMLFGFADGRSRELRYEPVLGGRHGGRLLLRDRDEGLWTLERYGDARRVLQLARPDGSSGDPAELGTLLGGADAHLFRSVFAFGLDELQAFETLNGESVRDRIFSAGISGAGKSAREVMARLEKRQAKLLKHGAGKALMNDVVRQIREVDESENAALALVREHESLQGEEGTQRDLAGRLQEESDRVQRRMSEVKTFIELRPQWEELEGCRLALGDLRQIEDDSLPDRVAGLVMDLEAQRTREERLPELEGTRGKERADVDAALARLGGGWDIERAQVLDTSLAVEDEVRAREQQLGEAEEALDGAEQRRVQAEEAEGSAQAALERLRSELPEDEPLLVEEIDRREALLRGLRDDIGRLETLRLKAEQQAPAATARAAWLVYVLAAASGLGAGVSWLAGGGQIGVGLLVAAILVLMAGVLARGRKPAIADSQGQPRVIDELLATMGEAAASLGLPSQPSTQDLGELEARLKTERTQRSSWESAAGLVREAERQVWESRRSLDNALEAEGTARAECDRALEDWSLWLDRRGVASLSPHGFAETLRQVRAAVDSHARLAGAIAGMDEIDEKARFWDTAAREVLAMAGRETGSLSREALRSAVGALSIDLERRGTLRSQADSLEGIISVRLSSCADPGLAQDELACGDAGVWEDELGQLGTELASLREQRDAAIEAATSARDRLSAIEQSADIPRLQEERESLRAQLAELAREFRVASVANALIAQTLATFVRERQPAVLASGSDAFATVTSGRYVRVQQDDASALESVVAVNRDGQQLTPELLSRGTQQQLYLAIRLALIAEFSKRTEALPLIMDDCLVNFDPKRAAAVAALLAERSADGQCLLFTCHPETAELMAGQTTGPTRVMTMPGT